MDASDAFLEWENLYALTEIAGLLGTTYLVYDNSAAGV